MPHSLPETGFVRLANLLSPAGPIPVSKSYIYSLLRLPWLAPDITTAI
jgi:hypothetical protein